MKRIIFGNIVTVDRNNKIVTAMIEEDGVITFVGDKQDALKYKDEAEIIDYGDNFIYPGFIEPHCHGLFAGYRAIGQADLSSIYGEYEEYIPVIKEFINNNPNKEIYIAAGWNETGRELDHNFLDDFYNEKPLILNTAGGHSCLLNTKAMEYFNINKDAVKKYGKNLVHVYDNGEPTGYVCEGAAVSILNSLPIKYDEAKEYILKWQNIALEKGYTTVCDAGSELIYKDSNRAYNELEKENKLKLRTYCYSIVEDNVDDPSKAIDNIVELKNKYNNEYFKIIGAKVFLDGVGEARTSWTREDYADEKGYRGLQRFSNENKMVELITCASKNNLSVHAHSEGDGATSFFLNCINQSQKITNDYDQRNVIAHLHFVDNKDFENMKNTNSIPLVAPLWVAKFPGAYEKEVDSFGIQMAENAYPIKSFFDNGCKVCYHTDYPISPILNVTRSIYMAYKRTIPEEKQFNMDLSRNINETVDRLDSLKALTINGAYALKQEKHMGSLEVGKIANYVVMDGDLLNSDINDLLNIKILKTVVDGKEAYSLK